MRHVTLRWQRFSTLTAARSAFGKTPCVYVQADKAGRALRVGKATSGLGSRYRGGTGYALDAAMHGSGNRVFVAAVPAELVGSVETALIWKYRDVLRYNEIGKLRSPVASLAIRHTGDTPSFVMTTTEGAGRSALAPPHETTQSVRRGRT